MPWSSCRTSPPDEPGQPGRRARRRRRCYTTKWDTITYAAFCADFERKLEDRIRVAKAREGVFANILGDPAPELERALADNPDTERLRFIARYVTDQYQGEVGGEPAIRSTIDALRARGDRETLDRFAATLIARRKPSYLSFIDLTGRWAAEAEQAATAFVQSVRDAEVTFASVFDHADHGQHSWPRSKRILRRSLAGFWRPTDRPISIRSACRLSPTRSPPTPIAQPASTVRRRRDAISREFERRVQSTPRSKTRMRRPISVPWRARGDREPRRIVG